MLLSHLNKDVPAPALSKHLVPDLPTADELLPYLRRIDQARWYSNFGPLVCEFEQRMQTLLAALDPVQGERPIHLTTLASGQLALQIGLHLLGVRRGSRVLVPAVTFTACPLAVQQLGAEPVLADVDSNDWTLTPQTARAAASRMKIDAIMPVAVYGVPLDASAWDGFSRETGIPVMIDAAAAAGVQRVPQNGLVAYSLHATKPFGIGEGGILAGRDADMIKRSRQYSNFGMVDRICHMEGNNAKLSEYHGAVGLSQMDRWEVIKSKRRKLLSIYVREQASITDLATLQPSIGSAVVSCLMLLLRKPMADTVLGRCKEAGIATHRTYLPPLYRHPYFENLTVVDVEGIASRPEADVARKRTHMPHSERLLASIVGLPFHHLLVEEDVANLLYQLRSALSVRYPSQNVASSWL